MSEEKYKICPVCGGRMWMNTGGWMCGNCGALMTADGTLIHNYGEVKAIVDAPLPDVKFIPTFDWQAFRAEAAKDILCAFASNERIELSKDNIEKSVECSIALADILIIKLKGDGNKD